MGRIHAGDQQANYQRKKGKLRLELFIQSAHTSRDSEIIENSEYDNSVPRISAADENLVVFDYIVCRTLTELSTRSTTSQNS